MGDDTVLTTIPVEIKNWADPIKPPFVKKSTLKTYIIDPAGVDGPKYVQISDYEPKRFRMVIQVLDVPAVLLLDVPTVSPDTSTPSVAPSSGGMHLGNGATPRHEFFGPDAMWINSLNAVTRVCVLKEYC